MAMQGQHVTALLLAAGDNTRMGSATPKVMADLAGRSVLEWSVAAFVECDEVDGVVVVARDDHVVATEQKLSDVAKVTRVVPGGPTRSASALSGLEAVPGDGLVLVHDAARPLVTTTMISALVSRLGDVDAATVAIPASDTMLDVEEGYVAGAPGRTLTWHAQTPQGFRASTLRAAFAASTKSRLDFTDECSLVLRYSPETRIAVVSGSSDNIKITTPGDLEIAEGLLAARAARDTVPYSD